MGTLKARAMENCDNSSFVAETEDLERDSSHLSTGMNKNIVPRKLLYFWSLFRWKTAEH